MQPRPNILWLCSDQQRYDTIAALGNSLARSPNIDRLIEEGVAFRRAYCQSPVCTPSRASFLTGRYPRTTRCRQNGQQIPTGERLLPRLFADAGYRCGLAGKLHLSSCSDGKVEQRIDDGYEVFHWSHHPQPGWGQDNAYWRWLEEKGTNWSNIFDGSGSAYVKKGVPAEFHQTTFCADKTIDFIRASADRPWFFSFNCFDPHHPFDPPPEYLERYDIDAMPLPKFREGELERKTTFQQLDHNGAHNSDGEFAPGTMTDRDRREIYAANLAMCELIDDQVGRILEALVETGQADNTIVIYMSDHGEMLGDHGIYFKGPHFYESAIRVPLVVRWPNGYKSGLQVDGLVELLDLAPTLLEAAGLDVPEAMQGRSLNAMCRGESDPIRFRDQVFCEYYNAWTHSDAYATMLRTEQYKIVVYHGTDQGELYDLVADPDEFANLWASDEHKDLKLKLMTRCFDASVFTMDPTPPRLGPY
jgi:arylsulfatase